MAQIIWTRRALRNLEVIRAYISQFSPLAAQRMALRLISAAQALDEQPERGRPLSGGRRELTTIPPYLIRYRLDGKVVTILDVRHGARKPIG
jgi:toxin ParE1/3/4